MNYRHLTADELVRHICTQAGDDLELEGELIRRLRADEVSVSDSSAIDEVKEELAGKEEELTELRAENTALQAKLEKIETAADALEEALA